MYHITADADMISVADAIRAKAGVDEPLTFPSEFVSVIQSIPTGDVTYQTKSVTPSESQQTVSPDTGYNALLSVTVNAIPTTYVGSGISRRSGTDLTASGAEVSVPAGYYNTATSKSVASGTAGTPIATKGTVSNHSVSVTPVVTNTTGYITGSTKTGTAVSVSASELVSGSQTINTNGPVDVTNLAQVVVDVPTGGTLQTKNVTPSETAQTITPDTGYDGMDQVNVDAVPSDYVGSGIARRSAADMYYQKVITVPTVMAPAGYYADLLLYRITSGTEGTPTATKGSVSNHSVSVTPSVTNSEGYIFGSTKTGTAVTVSASELVSGDLAITANGNNIDVTNYETVSVNVPSSGSSKNVQIAQGVDRVNTTSYTAVSGQSITVAKTGTYDVYWTGFRSSTGGTNGSQLYIGNTEYGTAQTTFTNHGQSIHLSGVSLTQGQTVTVRARARGTSYYMYVGNLTIIES